MAKAPRPSVDTWSDSAPLSVLNTHDRSSIHAFRWMLIFGAVAIPFFWAVYAAVDPQAMDPVWLRLAVSAGFLCAIGLSYVRRAQPYLYGILLACTYGCTGVIAWVCVQNGLDTIWGIGLMTTFISCAVPTALYAPDVRRSVLGISGLLAVVAAFVVTAEQAVMPAWLFLSCVAVTGAAALIVGIAHGRMVQSLQASEARVRSILDAAPDAVLTICEKDIVHDANAAVETVFGFSVESVLGRPLVDTIVPERLRGQHLANLRRFAESSASGVPLESLRATGLHADGTEIPVEMTFRPMRLASGALAFTINLRDMRAQVAAENQLVAAKEAAEEKERLVRTVIDAIPEHIYVKDRQGRCIIRNAFSAAALGYAHPDEAIGLTVFDTAGSPEIAAAYWEREDAVMASGAAEIGHEEPYASGDEAGWIVTSRIPIRDAAGAVVGLVGVTRDVTAQKMARTEILAAKEAAEAAKDAAEENARIVRTVIDAIPDMIFVTDREGRCITRNIADARAIGYENPHETVGLTVFDTTTPESADALYSVDQAVMASGEARIDGEDLVVVEGHDRVFRSSKVPLRDESGAVVGLVGIVRDVTEYKTAEAELVAAKEAAEAATRESDAKQRLIQTVIDAIPDHIYAMDHRGPIHAPQPGQHCSARSRVDRRGRRENRVRLVPGAAGGGVLG